MDWTNDHDIIFCREIIAHDLYQYKQGSREHGACLDKIALILNELDEPWFKVDQRALRDRLKKLLGKYSKSKNELEKASGIEVEEDELFDLLSEIYNKKHEWEVFQDNKNDDKSKKVEEEERKNAENVCNLASERLSETKKKLEAAEDLTYEVTPKKVTRSSGNSTIMYLREKSEKEQSLREAELGLKQKELDFNVR